MSALEHPGPAHGSTVGLCLQCLHILTQHWKRRSGHPDPLCPLLLVYCWYVLVIRNRDYVSGRWTKTQMADEKPGQTCNVACLSRLLVRSFCIKPIANVDLPLTSKPPLFMVTGTSDLLNTSIWIFLPLTLYNCKICVHIEPFKTTLHMKHPHSPSLTALSFLRYRKLECVIVHPKNTQSTFKWLKLTSYK